MYDKREEKISVAIEVNRHQYCLDGMVNALLALHRQEEVIVSIKRFEFID